MGIHLLQWDSEALQLAGISADQLPELVPTTRVLSGLLTGAAEAVRLPATTPVVVGAGDGPLANLGLGAVVRGWRPAQSARAGRCVSWPSARSSIHGDVVSATPLLNSAGSSAVPLTKAAWCWNGLVSRSPRSWATDVRTNCCVSWRGAGRIRGLDHAAVPARRACPALELVFLGAYIGLTREHRRGHLIRAALEGVCGQLALMLESVRDSANEVREVRATGGFARSTLWRQAARGRPGNADRLPYAARRLEFRRGATRHGRARACHVDRSCRKPRPNRRNGRP